MNSRYECVCLCIMIYNSDLFFFSPFIHILKQHAINKPVISSSRLSQQLLCFYFEGQGHSFPVPRGLRVRNLPLLPVAAGNERRSAVRVLSVVQYASAPAVSAVMRRCDVPYRVEPLTTRSFSSSSLRKMVPGG